MIARSHHPVLLAEVVAMLAPRDGDTVIDATFGRGGYAAGLLAAAGCDVIGIDRDPQAIAEGAAMVKAHAPRLTLVQARFGEIDRLAETEDRPIQGVAFDLGVSSPQLDTPERGFSFRADGPLDMRMEAEGPSAADLVNTADEADLTRIIRDWGEERFARRVARAILTARAEAPIDTTDRLAEIVRRAVPPAKDGIDPATRTFQGLRIAVNDELGELDRGLAAAERILAPGGRLAVVSFHSLEDRRVKRFLADRSGKAPGASRHLPQPSNDRRPSFRLLTRKPVTPSAAEIAANPRARSAKLRGAERTDAPAWPAEVAA